MHLLNQFLAVIFLRTIDVWPRCEMVWKLNKVGELPFDISFSSLYIKDLLSNLTSDLSEATWTLRIISCGHFHGAGLSLFILERRNYEIKLWFSWI